MNGGAVHVPINRNIITTHKQNIQHESTNISIRLSFTNVKNKLSHFSTLFF